MYLRRSHVTPSCVNHHTDLFVQYFQAFSSAIWTLLAAIGASGSSLKFQEVAVAALHFFSSVCTKQLFREAFQSGDMLQQLISNVIVPNCVASELLLEQFDLQPHLFIKNYEEVLHLTPPQSQGYKTDSQRYAVAHLITALKRQFQQNVVSRPRCHVVRPAADDSHSPAAGGAARAARLRLSPLPLPLR